MSVIAKIYCLTVVTELFYYLCTKINEDIDQDERTKQNIEGCLCMDSVSPFFIAISSMNPKTTLITADTFILIYIFVDFSAQIIKQLRHDSICGNYTHFSRI